MGKDITEKIFNATRVDFGTMPFRTGGTALGVILHPFPSDTLIICARGY